MSETLSRFGTDSGADLERRKTEEALDTLQAEAGVSDEQLADARRNAERLARSLSEGSGSSEELAAALRERRESRYQQVRQAMEESRAGSSVLLDRRLSDFSRGPGADISRELPRLRQRVLDLTPGRGGVLRRVLGAVPFARRGEQEAMRLQSGRSQIRSVVDSLAASHRQLQADGQELEQLGVRLTASVQTLRRELLQNQITSSEVNRELARAELPPARQAVLDQYLLRPLQQEAVDLSTQLQVALQALVAKQDIQETGRQLMEAVNRASTTTVAALETGLVLSGVVSDQARVGRLVVDISETTEKILLDNARMIRQNAVGSAVIASRPLIRVEVLTKAADTIEEGRREVEALRESGGRELERALRQLQALIGRSTQALEARGEGRAEK
ncbi:toxic anion resistance protein [Deinococcus sp.]|uniref:toxic anion resistance protein n=1 Tax=Deinococcus sp. TaxID=47478 RepID=UPI003C7B52EC